MDWICHFSPSFLKSSRNTTVQLMSCWRSRHRTKLALSKSKPNSLTCIGHIVLMLYVLLKLSFRACHFYKKKKKVWCPSVCSSFPGDFAAVASCSSLCPDPSFKLFCFYSWCHITSAGCSPSICSAGRG